MNTLSDRDIFEICNEMRLPLQGIYFKDQMPTNAQNGFYIINLQDSKADGHGTHWTACYLNNKLNLYFDSFGFSCPPELEHVLNNYEWNKKDIQNINSSSCGYYCIAFIKFMHRKHDIKKSFQTFVKLFSNDTTKNENILNSILYKRNF